MLQPLSPKYSQKTITLSGVTFAHFSVEYNSERRRSSGSTSALSLRDWAKSPDFAAGVAGALFWEPQLSPEGSNGERSPLLSSPAGVGVRLQRAKDKNIVVTGLSKQGAAFRSGKLKLGDCIVKVDGEAVGHLDPNQVSKMIAGEPGTPVTVTVLSKIDPSPRDVVLIRSALSSGNSRR